MKSKNYNPFKMWGAWVGALFLVFMAVSFSDASGLLLELNAMLFLPLSSLLIFLDYMPQNGNIIIGMIAVYGFLIGWIIHSIFRGLSNEED